jgi:anaerobic ribonucleoside-triphosphate reductase
MSNSQETNQETLVVLNQVATETKIPCEVYSRVVGYLRPVQNWNNGKQQEFAERITFRLRELDGEKHS